jgi:hypothetical protein
MLYTVLTFYIGPLPALVEEFNVKSASQMQELMQERLIAAAVEERNMV